MADVKPFESIDKQIEIFERRGLLVPDKAYAAEMLKRYNYYRLSGYTLTLRKNDVFYPGVSFENVMQLYHFDCELRVMLMHALECIEVELRTHIGYHHAKEHGPLGYMNSHIFSNQRHYRKFVSYFEKTISDNERSEVFVKHHEEHHNSEYPIWVAVELLSFGNLSKFFNIIDDKVKTEICNEYYYGIPSNYITNWMRCLAILRNICAHRARLYNRNFSIGVSFSEKDKKFFRQIGYKPDRIGKQLFFYILILDKVLCDSITRDYFRDQIDVLLKKYPFVRSRYMGFPENWRQVLAEMNNPKASTYTTNTDPAKPLVEA